MELYNYIFMINRSGYPSVVKMRKWPLKNIFLSDIQDVGGTIRSGRVRFS